MKLKDALISDVRKEGVWEALHELLFKIPPLKKYEPDGEIPLEKLEKLMWLFDEKHGVQLQYIMAIPQKASRNSNKMYECYYSCSIKNKHNQSWVGTVQGLTIYECYVKMVLLSYGYIRSKKG